MERQTRFPLRQAARAKKQATFRFDITKSGKVAVALEGVSLIIGVLLLLMRNLPAEIVVPVFWLLFPVMVLAALGGAIVGGLGLRSLYRALDIAGVGIGVITIVSVAIWMFLPRFLYH